MDEAFLLLTPGPVPVSDRVRRAMDREMISHRSREFEAMYERTQETLEYIFRHSTPDETPTSEDGTALVLNGSATMAMEAALSNITDRDNEVVVLVNGEFGRHFARIAERHARCTRIDVSWGESFNLETIESLITDDTDVVAMVHNETSAGLCNPVEKVGEVATEHDAQFIVDCAGSIGGDEFRIEDWHIDIAVTSSHRTLGAPPGLSALYLTEDGREAVDGDRAPFYEDLDEYLRAANSNQTPFTSAVPLFRALAEATEQLKADGIATHIERNRRQSRALREGLQTMGLELFANTAEETTYSNTVTAVTLPDAVTDKPTAFFDGVEKRNVSVGRGKAHLEQEMFLVSNMGHLESAQVLRAIRAIGEALADAGADVDVEGGIETAERVFAE